MTLTLTDIANEEGTDKGTVGPVESWPANNYTDVYDAYLHSLRDSPITLLEIGLGVDGPNWRAFIAQGRNEAGGASMRMWFRYFTVARILGIDVNPAAFLDNERIETGVVDQGDPGELRAFLEDRGVETLDVVIDDGSHRPDHQQISFATLFPHVAPGGLYFIEDLGNNGKGDGAADRHANEDVLNTRRVLRGFLQDGVFPEPNALGDTHALENSIASISLHCPGTVIASVGSVRRRLSMLLRGRSGTPHFETGTEKLAVLRKR